MSISALYMYMYYLEPGVQYDFPLRLTKLNISFDNENTSYSTKSSYYTILDALEENQQWKINLKIKYYKPNTNFTFKLSNIVDMNTLETYLTRSITTNEYGEGTIDIVIKSDTDSTFAPDNYVFNFFNETDTEYGLYLYMAEVSLLIVRENI